MMKLIVVLLLATSCYAGVMTPSSATQCSPPYPMDWSVTVSKVGSIVQKWERDGKIDKGSYVCSTSDVSGSRFISVKFSESMYTYHLLFLNDKLVTMVITIVIQDKTDADNVYGSFRNALKLRFTKSDTANLLKSLYSGDCNFGKVSCELSRKSYGVFFCINRD